MCNKTKTLCFSGHRAEKLPQTTEEQHALQWALREEIDKAIATGIDTFLMGACYGFDLIAANAVLLRQKILYVNDPPHIHLIAVVPFEGQANKWEESDRTLYFDTLARCDDVITLSTHYKSGCYHERNRWLVDHSSRMICYYDGGAGGTAYTVAYAQAAGIPITNLIMHRPQTHGQAAASQ